MSSTFPLRMDSKAWTAGISIRAQLLLGRAIKAAEDAKLPYDHPHQMAIAHAVLRECDIESLRQSGSFND